MRSALNWDMKTVGGIPTEKLERNLRQEAVYLDNDVRQMALLVREYAPLELLKLASWDRWRIGKEGDAWAKAVAGALVAWLQDACACASTFQGQVSGSRTIRPKDYRRLGTLFDDYVRRAQRYVDNLTVKVREESGVADPDAVEQFQSLASDRCLPPAGNEDLVEDRAAALRLRLGPFRTVLGQVFHAGLDGLVDALAALERNTWDGVRKLREDTLRYRQDLDAKVADSVALGQSFPDEQSRIDAIIRREHWRGRVDDLLARRDGYDLYDVGKVTGLDEHDRNLLSVTIGSVTEPCPLYPFGSLPSRSRPFLRGVRSSYAFACEHLLDHAYALVREKVTDSGLLSAKEWDDTDAEHVRLQTATMVHTLFGPDSFDLEAGMFDFPSLRLALVVVPPVRHDPFAEGPACLAELADAVRRLRGAHGSAVRTLVVDWTLQGSYPVRLEDNQLTLSGLQFVHLSRDRQALQACRTALGLQEPETEEQVDLDDAEEEETAKSLIADGTEPDDGGPDDGDETEEKADEEETERDFAEEMVQEIDDAGSPDSTQEDQASKETHMANENEQKPYSFASLLKDIASGNKEKTEPEKKEEPAVQESEPAVQEPEPAVEAVAAEDEEVPELEDLVEMTPVERALEGRTIPARLAAITEKLGRTDGALITLCKEGSDALLNASDDLIGKALSVQKQDGKDKMFTLDKYSLTFIVAAHGDDELGRYDRKENIGAQMFMSGKDAWNSVTLFYDEKGDLVDAKEAETSRSDYSALEWKYACGIGQRLLARRKQRS